MTLALFYFAFFATTGPSVPDDWRSARDAQDRAALDRIATKAGAQAQAKPNDAAAQYMAALAESYRAEVAMELKDKNQSRAAAESGIRAAERAVSINPESGEYHRILGTLCGQVIPANVVAGLKYGKCALEQVNKAIEIDPKSSDAYVSRGVGNYYLPESFGGGAELALKDFEKAIQLDPKNADAHVWLGIALRKMNRNAEARKALTEAVALNPARAWAKQQLEKTPAQ
jgi:tetratricopeptide (TPR) repeat protein